MISSTPVTIIGLTVGNISGFIAKQYVLINGLEFVRKTIDETVSMVAKQRFGVWAGTIFGHQAGNVFALPTTSFIGDIVWACVTEVIHSTAICTSRVIGLTKPVSSSLSAATILGIRVVASLIAYSMKTLVIHYSFSHVQNFLGIALPRLLPALCKYSFFEFYLQPFFSFGAVVVLTTPAVLLLADICGLLVQELLCFAGRKLLEKRLPTEICKDKEPLTDAL